jgi:hypothetical protein
VLGVAVAEALPGRTTRCQKVLNNIPMLMRVSSISSAPPRARSLLSGPALKADGVVVGYLAVLRHGSNDMLALTCADLLVSGPF